jgi:hypothetical protein
MKTLTLQELRNADRIAWITAENARIAATGDRRYGAPVGLPPRTVPSARRAAVEQGGGTRGPFSHRVID